MPSEILEAHPHLADLPPTLDDSQVGTPARRHGSVRRTATIDMVVASTATGTEQALVANRDQVKSARSKRTEPPTMD